MLLLLLCLLSTSSAFTSEVFNVIARDYIPYPSNEDITIHENIDTHSLKPKLNNFINVSKNTDNTIKYNELLSLLHNDKSNQAVLAHIGNKVIEPGVVAMVRGIEDRIRGKRDVEKNDNYDNLQAFERTERSAIKWLKNLVHQETSTGQPSTKRNPPLYLRQSHDAIGNFSFADLLEDLTKAIKTLNQNLVNMKLQVFLIKMPDDEDNKENEINPANVNRPKRQYDQLSHDNNVGSNITNNTVNFNTTVKTESTQQIKENISIVSSSDTNNNSSKDVNIPNKFKREVNATKYAATNLKNNSVPHTALSNVTVDKIPKSTANKSTESKINLTEVIDKIDDLNHDNSSEKSDYQSKYAITNETEINPGEPLNKNRTTQMRTINRAQNNLDVPNISANDREDLLFYIDQAYKDIKDKIIPMKAIKYKYSSLIMYKIGYIVANLDTLEVSLKKLINKLNIRKDNWNNDQLLRVYRKLNLSRNLVDNIMDYLHTYAANEQYRMSQ